MTNRVIDYCGFAVRFVGLGYVVVWPLSTPDPFALARFCRPRAAPWQWLCHWPQLVHLTPGLHLLGLVCAGALAAHLALRQAARWRRAQVLRASTARALAMDPPPVAEARPPRHSAFAKPPPKVAPRSQFGLRQGPLRDARRARDLRVSSPSRARMPAE
ncbi:MAG: hypothetical protein P8Y53_22510 [Pseudolabrys sp.]